MERHDQTPDLPMEPFLELSLEVRSIADFTGRIHWINEAYEESLGYSLEEINQIAWHRLAHPADLPRVMTQVGRMARGRMGRVDVRLRCKDGSFKWFRISAMVAPGTGHPLNRLFYTSGQEITDAKELAAAQNRFIANAAHELRTPVAMVAAMVETLVDHRNSMAADEVEEALAVLHRQSQRAERLVHSLLDHSRAELGTAPPNVRTVVLADVVKDAIGNAGLDGDVAVHIDPGLEVLADSDRLDQILVNLLVNADRYGGDEIRVEAEVVDDEAVTCRVYDDGPGVPSEFLPHLFDPFEQADPRGQGTGLGLAIARRLARAMDGEVSYEPNGQTCFAVRIPVASTGTDPLDGLTHQPD